MPSYRPKIKVDEAGNMTDLPIDAETLCGKTVDEFQIKLIEGDGIVVSEDGTISIAGGYSNLENYYTKTEVDDKINNKIGYIKLSTSHYNGGVSEYNHSITTLYNKMIELCEAASAYIEFTGYLNGLYYINIQYMGGVYFLKVTDALSLAKYEDYVYGDETLINEVIANRMNAVAISSDVYTKEEVDDKIANSGGGSVSGDYLPLTGGTIEGDLSISNGELTASTIVAESIGVSGGLYIDEGGYLSLSEMYVGQEDEVCISGSGIALSNVDIKMSDVHGITHPYTGNGIGFNDECNPTILNTNGRFFTIATDSFDGDYIAYLFPEKEGTVALVDDIPTYYMHTVSVSKLGGKNCNIAFTVINKSSTALTVTALGSTYSAKAFACSGYYDSYVTSKIAFIDSNNVRIVYGSGSGSTALVSGATISDTVIPVV